MGGSTETLYELGYLGNDACCLSGGATGAPFP